MHDRIPHSCAMTTAVLTFALDGETPVLAAGRRYAEHAMVMSHQAFESQVGLPRLLELLASFSLPATFFLVSQWIGSDVVPWWDRELGVRHPWMTWDQVRSLHRKGFDVGAHTRTHVDLGRISEVEAREEIFSARLELQRQLEAPVELFAYPYGGPNHLAEANRDVVKAAGFRCCCSCFGGLNAAGTDPFHLRRVPVSSWYASPHQFGLELALGMSVQSP